MKRVWKTPELDYYNLYADMLQQPHLLIAGATGSGKSVVINGMMTTALKDSPAAVQFILIDPKRVELVDYKELPHTLRYSSEPGEMVQALQEAIAITDNRYRDMARQHVKKYGGGAVYVVIDELADLMTTNKMIDNHCSYSFLLIVVQRYFRTLIIYLYLFGKEFLHVPFQKRED